MLVHPWDRGSAEQGWEFLRHQGFGQLIASGRGRDVPVVVPTQFSVVGGPDSPDDPSIVLHLARPNPIWRAVEENSTVVLSCAGDWCFVPGTWKAPAGMPAEVGIPTTFYTAVQVTATARVESDSSAIAAVLREQLADGGAGAGLVDPGEHERLLTGIRGLRLWPSEIVTKCKYGGNQTAEVRDRIAERLIERGGPGDAAALRHLREL